MSATNTKQIFQLEDRLGFIAQVMKRWPGPPAPDGSPTSPATLAEQDLHWRITGAEINASLSAAPGSITPMQMAARASDAGSPLRMTQQPRIDGAGKQTGDTLIFVGAFCVHIDLMDVALSLEAMLVSEGDLDAAVAAIDAIMADIAVLERCIYEFKQGQVLRFELAGYDCTELDASRALQALYSAASEEATLLSPYFGGQVLQKDRHWCVFTPFSLGVDQASTLRVFMPIHTFAEALVVDFRLRAIVASIQ